MSTLLTDLDEKTGGGDGDLVQKILSEMNGNPEPPASHVINAPNPNTMASRVMDTGPATAHIIGGQHPTAADFATAMGQNGQQWSGGAPVAAPQGGGQWASATPPPGSYTAPPKPTKSWISRISEEVKLPVFVAVLVFVFSLPIVNVLFSHYLPSVVKSTGELTTIGLLLKSIVAAISFWILQRVIVPLLSV
jgi:hypothetical protein